jgi:hypothetical protein
MRAVTLSRAIAVAAASGAVALLLTRGRSASDIVPIPLTDTVSSPSADERAAVQSAATEAADASETPAGARVRELNALSETFRNTTFLIAIRDAGFLCNDIASVYGGVDSSTTWTATCRDMLAYTVSVAVSGTLVVEPMMQYWDGVGPATTPRNAEPLAPPLQPQLLPPWR